VTHDGQEYKGRHEPLVPQELFDRVQRVLFAERRAGTRQRTHNHYLKGLVWCERCKRRLIIVPGKSKSGQVYFYYACQGKLNHTCKLGYMPLPQVERAVEMHYATVQIADEFRTAMTERLDTAASGSHDINRKLRAELDRNLKVLSTREDNLLDLVGHPTGRRRS
jgi:site-specific DNA recombinase